MIRIDKHASSLAELPPILHDLKSHLRYHTESGFSMEEADSYAQELDDVESMLMPLWGQRLQDRSYEIEVDCTPGLGGFLKIKVASDSAQPVEVFAESYGHFNAEMCDGSCYQYVYQKVLSYKDRLETGRVAL